MPKSERVVKAAAEASPPWEADDRGNSVTLTRGDETMVINWDPTTGALVHPLTYRLTGVREVKLRNVSAALKVIADKPKYTVARVRKREAPQPDPAGRALPFDPADDDDKTIIKAVRGKRLTWYNTMAGEYESAMVPDRYRVLVPDPDKPGQKKSVWRTSRNISMSTTKAGRRVLTFPAVGEQYRSVGLDSLVSVS